MGDGYGMWIVIAIVLFAIGQVFWVLPSPRQRGLARLRQHAYELGLRPQQRTFPHGLRLYGRSGDSMKYSLSRPAPDWPRTGPAWLAVLGTPDRLEGPAWASQDKGPQGLLDALAQAAPLGVAAVELDTSGAGFYWDESGDDAVLDQLVALLGQFTEAYVTSASGPKA